MRPAKTIASSSSKPTVSRSAPPALVARGQHWAGHAKKTLRASEQNEAARAAWREQASQLPTQYLVIVDETGSQINMTPLYAYAPRGERAIGKVPRNYGANLTLIASLSLSGMGEALMLDGSADAAAFEAYVEQILAPNLRPGQIVILDNLSIHQGPQVKQAIEARGCQLLFLPSYSPDLSLIEEALSTALLCTEKLSSAHNLREGDFFSFSRGIWQGLLPGTAI